MRFGSNSTRIDPHRGGGWGAKLHPTAPHRAMTQFTNCQDDRGGWKQPSAHLHSLILPRAPLNPRCPAARGGWARTLPICAPWSGIVDERMSKADQGICSPVGISWRRKWRCWWRLELWSWRRDLTFITAHARHRTYDRIHGGFGSRGNNGCRSGRTSTSIEQRLEMPWSLTGPAPDPAAGFGKHKGWRVKKGGWVDWWMGGLVDWWMDGKLDGKLDGAGKRCRMCCLLLHLELT